MTFTLNSCTRNKLTITLLIDIQSRSQKLEHGRKKRERGGMSLRKDQLLIVLITQLGINLPFLMCGRQQSMTGLSRSSTSATGSMLIQASRAMHVAFTKD